MKQKKRNPRGKPDHRLNDRSDTETTDETALMEKLKLQNTALEKIKTAVLVSNGVPQDEGK